MSPVFDCSDPEQVLVGSRRARQAIAQGALVVLPTDTVYGVAADAFSPAAVARLLAAKGRGRQSPPPVLVSGVPAMRALVADVPPEIERLTEAFWPGGLTIVLPAQPSLAWDLGETHGTVAVRMPDEPIALALLEDCGPLAVSSANLTGKKAAITIDEARDMLRDSVDVYLDGGISEQGVSSTIVDATTLVPGVAEERRVRILRDGAITREQLQDVLGDLLEPAEEGADDHDHHDHAPRPTADPAPAAPTTAQSPTGSDHGDAANAEPDVPR